MKITNALDNGSSFQDAADWDDVGLSELPFLPE